GSNSYTGVTQVTNGSTLSISSLANINGNSSAYVAVQSGGTLKYTGGGIGGPVTETKTGFLYWNSGAATIDVTQSNANLIFSITGGARNAGFTKAGAGTLTLSDPGNTTYIPTITGGTLELNC